MSELLPSPSDCCRPCPEPLVTDIPGSQGPAGADGADGVDGINAFTLTTNAFTMPAEAASVAVDVGSTAWMAVGQKVFIGKAASAAKGTFQVAIVNSTTNVTLTNVEDTATSAYTENSPPGTVFPSGSEVSPSGLQGPIGATPGGVFLITNNLSEGVLATKQSNLGIGTAGTRADGYFFQVANNLSEGVGATKRTNLGLGSAAVKDAGVANTKLPPVDQVAGLTAGQAVFATASGVESKTAAAAKTALGISGMAGNYVLLQNHQAGDAAAFASGGAVAVPLNTEVSDAGGVCSLNAGTFVFTLAPGTYRMRASVPAWSVGIFQALLFNVTLGSIVFYGTNAEACSSAPVSSGVSFVVGRFTVPLGGADYQLRAQCITGAGAGGFGKTTGLGNDVYASCELEQET